MSVVWIDDTRPHILVFLFLSQVIFGSQGAMAGVQGVAAVSVRVEGLPFGDERDGEMELDGLPFQGNVRIGKRSTFLMPGTLHD